MDPVVRIATDGGVAIVTIDNPPVNALSAAVREQLDAAFDRVASDPETRAVVVTGAGRAFVAGADIKELERVAATHGAKLASFHRFLQKIEDSAKPVVMAVNGACVGGGNELAMAGHYRLAAPGAQFGQPEVNLGLIPGAEGTQRLPRLAGVAAALDLCVSGKSIGAEEALALGWIDRVVAGDLLAEAVAFASQMADRGAIRKTSELNEKLSVSNPTMFDAAREVARRARPNQIAPLRVVDAIEAAITLSFTEGAKRERELFDACIASDQARALIYYFFAERGVAKFNEGSGDIRLIEAPSGRLVEIVNGTAAALAQVKKAGKIGVVVNTPVGERVMEACRAEARSLIAEGTTARHINSALIEFGMTTAILSDDADESDTSDVTASEIVARCLRAMANEGNKLLSAGAAARAADMDVILVAGYGFPAYRGGPMWYAEH